MNFDMLQTTGNFESSKQKNNKKPETITDSK